MAPPQALILHKPPSNICNSFFSDCWGEITTGKHQELKICCRFYLRQVIQELVCQWSGLRCSQSFSNVLRWSQMFSDVLRCSQMFLDVLFTFSDVLRCSLHVLRYSQMFPDVLKMLSSVQRCSIDVLKMFLLRSLRCSMMFSYVLRYSEMFSR